MLYYMLYVACCDVQVRAYTRVGAGPWSVMVEATTIDSSE